MPEFDFTDEALAGLTGEDNPAPEEAETPPAGEVVVDDGRETETEPEVAPEPELILGKFKTQAEMIESYKALEQKLGDPERLDLENRKLRDELDEIRGLISQPEPQYDQGAVDRLIEDNPGQAAAIAYQAGDTYRFQEALTAWKDTDPFAAAVWVADIRREDEMARLRQEYESRIEASAQETQSAQFNRAWRDVSTKFPDVEQYADAILEAAQSAPEIISGLQSGAFADKTRVIENLYWLAKGRKADSLAAVATEMAAGQKEERRQEKVDAAVTGASSTSVQPEEKSATEKFYERMLTGPNTSIREGLTGTQ